MRLSCMRLAISGKLPPAVKLNHVKFEPTDAQNLRPLVVIHGLFDHARNWASLCKQLATRCARTTYMLDMRNHGDSPRTSGESCNYLAMSTDVHRFFNDHGIASAVVMGHSMGARIVCQFVQLFVSFFFKLIRRNYL